MVDALAADAAGGVVDLGGDLRVWGKAPAGAPGWPIAVEDVRSGRHAALLGLAAGAVATSTVLRRRWQVGERRAHHLIDPATGRPSDGELVAVTVVAGEATGAEVLAKAALDRRDDLSGRGAARRGGGRGAVVRRPRGSGAHRRVRAAVLDDGGGGVMAPEIWWYLARATGLVAWALAVGSLLLGLALATRAMGPKPKGPWLLDLHRWLGGLAVVFTAAHVGGLIADSYVSFDLVDALVPFAASWRPGAVAWGVSAHPLERPEAAESRGIEERFRLGHPAACAHRGQVADGGALVPGPASLLHQAIDAVGTEPRRLGEVAGAAEAGRRRPRR